MARRGNYSDDCCRWTGVRCRWFGVGAYHRQEQLRVVSLDLADIGLAGPVAPRTLDRLDMLRFLNLSRNSLNGAVPLELLRMPRLLVLDLSQNSPNGVLSARLVGSSSRGSSGIRHLDISFNSLTSLGAT
jgi:hypothetical protein